jgi:hypothetical protein
MARPASPDRKIFEDSGQPFFDAFDPLNAKSLEITSYNQSANNWHSFKVAQAGGKWLIPSHENYPADAKDHLAQAAASVLDLKKGPKASDNPGDHELYGVVDPTDKGAGLGSGTHVTLQDEGGKPLIDLIIGKAVKDSENLHYVRVPGKDRVYTAKVNTEKLSTKFEDWIERDLLKLNPSLIKDVIVEDYDIDEINGKINQGDRMRLHYASSPPPAPEGTPPPPAWTMDDLRPGEALSTQKLDDMRSSLGDLKIIDVHKKPAGLSAQLASSGGITLDPESLRSLETRGYYVIKTDQGNRLLSNLGEITVRTTEGVDYNLRFGEVINVEGGSDLNAKEGESASTQQNGRFLFVTAAFNASMIDVPKFELLPDPASQPATAPAETQPASAPEDPVRQAVIAANDQKRKDYEAKIKAGEDKVKELNARFADWYYVVSDGVYEKLRFKRADIVISGNDAMPQAPLQLPPPPATPGGM